MSNYKQIFTVILVQTKIKLTASNHPVQKVNNQEINVQYGQFLKLKFDSFTERLKSINTSTLIFLHILIDCVLDTD